MGMFVRALAYMLSHGSDGMKQASEDAVLNANYIRAGLSDLMSLPFGDKPCMHEVLFDDAWLKDTGVTTLDFAKAMIDEGYHPMTMYFPLVVHGAMLIEPTESESKASLDLFIATLRDLAMAAKRGETERFTGAPYHAPAPPPRRDPRGAQPGAAMDAAGAGGGGGGVSEQPSPALVAGEGNLRSRSGEGQSRAKPAVPNHPSTFRDRSLLSSEDERPSPTLADARATLSRGGERVQSADRILHRALQVRHSLNDDWRSRLPQLLRVIRPAMAAAGKADDAHAGSARRLNAGNESSITRQSSGRAFMLLAA